MSKTPTHLGIAFNSCPIYWDESDWHEFIRFFQINRIEYVTLYTRNGWENISEIIADLPAAVFGSNGKIIKQCTNETVFLSFIDYNDSKPRLAALTRKLCESKGSITQETLKCLDNCFPRLDFLLVEDHHHLGGFPPLMLAFTEIFTLSSLDDSIHGFMDGIEIGIKRYSQTIQRNGI